MPTIKWIFLLLAVVLHTVPTVAKDRLYENFRNPPAQARPFVRWWWNGDCVETREILRELDILKAAGIGGVEINPIAMPSNSKQTGAKPLIWLSDEWNHAVKTACEGAKKRGLIADMIVGSGWPFGGRFLKSEEIIEGVSLIKKELTEPGKFPDVLNIIKEIVTSVQSRQKSSQFSKSRLLFVRLVPDNIRDPNDIIDFTDKLGKKGATSIDIPPGKYTVYVGIIKKGFKTVSWGAPGADGPVLDHYNKEAVEKYLARMSNSLGPVLGGRLGDGFRAMFCDSIELSGANWTSGFATQFRERRGYSISPYLPFVFEQSLPQTNSSFADTILRVRYDFYKTLVELFQQNFIETFHNWCHHNGTLSRYQAYGSPWLMGMMDGYMMCDIPEGDTWIFGHPPVGQPLDNIRYAVWNKYASSGAHLTDRRLISCESMTNVTGVFKATLEYIKQADDLNFITGINQTVLHGFNYSPPEAGFPGWIRYGTYFNEHNSWWSYFKKWADYHARLSSIFQSASYQGQVAIFGPTADVWSRSGLNRDPFIKNPWYLHRLWQSLHSNGYCTDYVNATVLEGAKFPDGRLNFGSMAYNLLILADVQTLRPETAVAIEKYAKAGGRIIFAGKLPNRSPGLKNAEINDGKVKAAINNTLKAGGKRVSVVTDPDEGSLLKWTRTTLAKTGVLPAVSISNPDSRLFQVHYNKDDRDIFYFVNSHKDKSVAFRADFALSSDKTPWCWDAETGRRWVFPYTNKQNRLDINLKPLESLLLVFEPDMPGEPARKATIKLENFLTLTGPWQVTFSQVQKGTFRRVFDSLEDFSKSTDPQVKSFAGTARYRMNFYLPGPLPIRMNLGKVCNISEVTLNGKLLGVRWWGQHSYDIGSAVKIGQNVLEVKVTTVLSNYCRSLKNNPVAQKWTKGREPVCAGLIGPVKLSRAK